MMPATEKHKIFHVSNMKKIAGGLILCLTLYGPNEDARRVFEKSVRGSYFSLI